MRITLLPILLGKINFRKEPFTLYSEKLHLGTDFIRSFEIPSEKQHLGTDFIRPFKLSSEFIAKYNLSLNPDLSIKIDNSVNITVSPENNKKIKSIPKKYLKVSTNYIDRSSPAKQIEDLLWTATLYYFLYLVIMDIFMKR